MSHTRDHRGSRGTKIRYETRERAKHAAAREGCRLGKTFKAYRCSHCHWFHIGSHRVKHHHLREDWLVLELGDRAVAHFNENTGNEMKRLAAMTKRFRAQQRKMRARGTEPDSTE